MWLIPGSMYVLKFVIEVPKSVIYVYVYVHVCIRIRVCALKDDRLFLDPVCPRN